jgi:hypothetical protein
MPDPTRIITNRAFAGEEKQEMLKAIQDLQHEVKALSASVSEKIGSRPTDSDYEAIVSRSLKKHDKSKETVEERANRIVKEFNEKREDERKENAAQIQAQFNILGQRLKTPIRSGASSLLSGAADVVGQKRDYAFNNNIGRRIDEGNKQLLSSALNGLGKLIAPKMEAEKKADRGQHNTNSPIDRNEESSRHGGLDKKLGENKKKISILRKMMKNYEKIGNEDGKVLQTMIDQYEKQDEKEQPNHRKLITVEELAAEKEQAQYDKENDEKKEVLANMEAKVKIMKQKYVSSGWGDKARWLASDSLTGIGDMVGHKRNDDFNNNTSKKISQKNKETFRKVGKFASQVIKPWMPSGPSPTDKSQVNPNDPDTSESLGGSIREDISEIRKAVIRENALESKEDSELDDIYDEITGISSKAVTIDDQTDELETSLSKLYRYVKGGSLVWDIVDAINDNKEYGSQESNQNQESQNKEGNSSEENGDEEDGGGGKWGKMKSRLAKMDSSAKGRTPGMKWMGKGPGIGGAAGGAMTAAAVVALGAASAYTIYETAKTANAITEGKSNVRDSTKGSAESAAAKNQEKYTKDHKEVQASAPRYEKAGLSKDEALSTSLAERQNSKMLASAASMSGIFGAARHSTDVRSSEAEVNKLLEGETLADTIRSGLQGLNQRLQDPNSVSKMSPAEIKSVSNQAKITLKQIGDLKKTWEESKKLGSGWLDSQWLKDETMVADGDSVINSLTDSGKDIESAFNDWEKDLASGAKDRSAKKKDDKKDGKESSKATGETPKESGPQEVEKSSATGFDSKERSNERKARYERLKKEGKITGDPDIDAETMISEEKIEKMHKGSGTKSVDEEADSRFDALNEATKTGKMKPPEGYRELTEEEKDKKYQSQQKLRENLSAADKDSKPAIAKVGEELKGAISDQNKNIADKLDALTTQVAKLADKKTPPPAYQYPAHQNPSFASIQTTSKGL